MMTTTVSIKIVAAIIITMSQAGCFQAIKDETNFTRPELGSYRTIVVLPFCAREAGIDGHYCKALEEHWLRATIVTSDSVLARFGLDVGRSLNEARLSFQEIGLAFGADAVIKGIVESHPITPLNKQQGLSQLVMHLRVYVVDLTTNETVACYQNEKTIQTTYDRAKERLFHYSVFKNIATENAQGLARLAYSSGHM
jgi:hypothetical protein